MTRCLENVGGAKGLPLKLLGYFLDEFCYGEGRCRTAGYLELVDWVIFLR